jgi:hypothetical protein
MMEEELKKYKEEELQTLFWIRVEEARPGDVITNHQNLSLDKDVAPGWTSKQIEEMGHLDDSLRLLGEEVAKSFHRRWTPCLVSCKLEILTLPIPYNFPS